VGHGIDFKIDFSSSFAPLNPSIDPHNDKENLENGLHIQICLKHDKKV
jgi:hypothetical protein